MKTLYAHSVHSDLYQMEKVKLVVYQFWSWTPFGSIFKIEGAPGFINLGVLAKGKGLCKDDDFSNSNK